MGRLLIAPTRPSTIPTGSPKSPATTSPSLPPSQPTGLLAPPADPKSSCLRAFVRAASSSPRPAVSSPPSLCSDVTSSDSGPDGLYLMSRPQFLHRFCHHLKVIDSFDGLLLSFAPTGMATTWERELCLPLDSHSENGAKAESVLDLHLLRNRRSEKNNRMAS